MWGCSGGLPLLGAFNRLMRTHPRLRGRAEPRPPSATATHAAAGSRGGGSAIRDQLRRSPAEPRPPSASAIHAAAGSGRGGPKDQRSATSGSTLPLPGPSPGRGPGQPVAAVGSGSFPVIQAVIQVVLTRVVLTRMCGPCLVGPGRHKMCTPSALEGLC